MLPGQNNLTISGQVLDAERNEPLTYVSVGIQNKSIGTITDEQGIFLLRIPATSLTDTLLVSMLGFTTHSIVMDELVKTTENRIYLKPEPIRLKELVINEKQLTGEQIYNLVLKNGKYNYPDQAYSWEANLREIQGFNGALLSSLQAKLTAQGTKFAKDWEQLYVVDVIKSVMEDSINEQRLRLGDNYNSLMEMQSSLRMIVRTKHRMCKNCKFKLEEYVSYDGRPAYIISSLQTKLNNEVVNRHIRIVVDAENYAVLRMDFEGSWPFGYGSRRQINDSLESDNVYMKKSFAFSLLQDRHYLDYYSNHVKFEYRSIQSGKISYKSDYYIDVIIDKVITQDVMPLNQDEIIDYRSGLWAQMKNVRPEDFHEIKIPAEVTIDQALTSLQKAVMLRNKIVTLDK